MNVMVDAGNPIAVRAAGIRVLNEGLGSDLARVFIKQYFGGSGDYTKEKYERPDLTQEEFDALLEDCKAEAVAAGVWE